MCYNISKDGQDYNMSGGVNTFYEEEFKFLSSTLTKCYIPSFIAAQNDSANLLIEPHIKDIVNIGFPDNLSIQEYLGEFDALTKYKFTDKLDLCYIYLVLPSSDKEEILFIGPYRSSAVSSKELLELGERLGIHPSYQKYFEEYYSSITVLNESDHLFHMIDTFCEHIWCRSSFAIVELNKQELLPPSPINDISSHESFDDVMANVKIMENRYSFENELIQAVSRGQQHKEMMLTSAFNDQLFEKRLADPLRNAKNYCIIMNTLLRKAAEQGGVHPIYIDRMSSKFASAIETCSSTKESSELMKDMFSSYCRLVYKHSVRKFSPIVQKTVLIIDSDLSAELSLSALAKHQGISSGYLATIFKKETGKTLSEYVREKRIKHAMYLLNTTSLQIQTIASHCGIMDLQYFSKIFKKQVGKTPKEYRESVRQ